MPTAQTRAALARRNKNLRKKAQISREKAIDAGKAVRGLRKENRELKRRVEELSKGYVVECCAFCETEIQMVWDPMSEGYRTYCPYCGHRLMLCDECQHRSADGSYTDDCDYDYGTDSCRFNQRNMTRDIGRMKS